MAEPDKRRLFAVLVVLLVPLALTTAWFVSPSLRCEVYLAWARHKRDDASVLWAMDRAQAEGSNGISALLALEAEFEIGVRERLKKLGSPAVAALFALYSGDKAASLREQAGWHAVNLAAAFGGERDYLRAMSQDQAPQIRQLAQLYIKEWELIRRVRSKPPARRYVNEEDEALLTVVKRFIADSSSPGAVALIEELLETRPYLYRELLPTLNEMGPKAAPWLPLVKRAFWYSPGVGFKHAPSEARRVFAAVGPAAIPTVRRMVRQQEGGSDGLVEVLWGCPARRPEPAFPGLVGDDQELLIEVLCEALEHGQRHIAVDVFYAVLRRNIHDRRIVEVLLKRLKEPDLRSWERWIFLHLMVSQRGPWLREALEAIRDRAEFEPLRDDLARDDKPWGATGPAILKLLREQLHKDVELVRKGIDQRSRSKTRVTASLWAEVDRR